MKPFNPATVVAQHTRSSFDSGIVLDYRNLDLLCSLGGEQKVVEDFLQRGAEDGLVSSQTRQLLEIGLNRFVSSWSSSVPKIVEPQASPVPVVKIEYTAEFDGVMSFFRGIVQISEETASPRYCALLSYVLSKCPANYNAWRRKRDLVMSPEEFLFSAQHWWQLPSLSKKIEGEDVQSMKNKILMQRHGIVNTLRQFTPNLVRDFAPGGVYCPLRAVRWELNLAKSFCIGNPKNFQTFCHRKELLTFAASLKSAEGLHLFELSQLKPDDPSSTATKWVEASRPIRHVHEVGSSQRSEDPVLESYDGENSLSSIPLGAPPMGIRPCGAPSDDGEHSSTPRADDITELPLTFEQFDDRPLMNLMLANDAKNYHVWSYRAWFVSFFPHLLSTEEGFSDEMIFTSEMIDKDFMNNSAWCHRFFLLRKIFEPNMPGLERPEYSLEASTAIRGNSVYQLFEDWHKKWEITEDEIFNTAFKALALEPNNECPYSHCLGLIDLFSRSFQENIDGGGRGSVGIAITEGVVSAPFFSAKIPGNSDQEKFEFTHSLPLLTKLHLLFVGRLFQQVFPRIGELEPEALELESAARVSERRPSLIGTFYGRHFFAAVVDSLERALVPLVDSLRDRGEPQEQPQDSAHAAHVKQIIQLVATLLQSSLTSLFERDTMRRKYWRQQLLNLQLELGENNLLK